MAKSNRERVESYRAKQRAAGIVEVLVRVPSSMRMRVLDLAAKLRAGAPWPQDPPSVRVVRVEVPGPVRVNRIEVPGPVTVDWVILASAVLPALALGVLAGVILQKYYHG